MAGKVSFVRADRRHAVAIAQVGQAIIAEMGAQAAALLQPMTAEAVARRLAGYRGRGAMFLAREGGQPVAFAALEPDPNDADTSVLGVWVLKGHRRRGIGRELALMALEFARRKGYRRLRGTIPEGNEAALSFFGELGSLAQAVGGGMRYELPL
ncbi:MAG TPA: GNAT family N-acetyltransferase [Dehalococcoidia bacterium]|nr:GNAT family N-acetyltransferase [Dehalococcoidia bacterium]